MPSNRRGPSGPQPREVLVSKKLSWLLRHGAEKEGLVLGKGGYVNLGDVLNNRNIRSLKATLTEIQDIVRSNEKQRFSLIHISSAPTADSGPGAQPGEALIEPALQEHNPAHYLIRANQGHSIAVESDDLLTPVTLSVPDSIPGVVVHGTRHDAWPLILASGGLKRMTRNHVHFATGVPKELEARFVAKGAGMTSEPAQQEGAVEATPTESAEPEAEAASTTQAPAVLSGMRNSSTLLIYIDIRAALAAGVPFFMSSNGVVLSAGDAEMGVVGLKYFQRVLERGGRELVKGGEVVAEADAEMVERAAKGARGRGVGGRGGRGEGRGGGGGGGRGRGRGTAAGGDAEA